MATPAPRYNHDILAIAFDYDVKPAEGDYVELIAGRKIQKVTAAGVANLVGEVETVRSSLGECTVLTRSRQNIQGRIAGEDVAIGPFVWGPDNKVYQYTPGAVASVVGSTTGAKTIVAGTSDAAKINYNNEGSQTFTLTAGVDVPMATVAAEINETAVGFVAGVDATGHFTLTGKEIGKPIEVEAVANDAYTLLGLTAGVTRCAGPSHDASRIAGLIVVGGDEGDEIETLEH